MTNGAWASWTVAFACLGVFIPTPDAEAGLPEFGDSVTGIGRTHERFQGENVTHCPATLDGHKIANWRWSMSLTYNRGRCRTGIPPAVEPDLRTFTVSGTFNPARRDTQCLRGAAEAGSFDYICFNPVEIGAAGLPSYNEIQFRDAGAPTYPGGGHLALVYSIRDVGRPV